MKLTDQELIRTVTTAHQLGGFKAAGEKLGISHRTVEYRLNLLERRFGKLFQQFGQRRDAKYLTKLGEKLIKAEESA